MRKIALTTLLIFQYGIVFGQLESDSSKSYNNTQAKHAIFFEILGSGGLYSINYERVIGENRTLRGGISYVNGDGFIFGHMLTIPLSTSYLFPTDKDSHIELGVGNTFILNEGTFSNAIGPIFGVREQDLFNGGAYARISFTPVLLIGKEVEMAPVWAGISFGKSFK
ncbi:hypothetical protein [Gracilimonas sediminicola]|uniref:Uncharacterized protein n=1 Tax=Gracilimonas sediminicola TaxID=2952158 RepID=A0A9X2L1T2_9BACT|nr:hypothetical protein [Gracilimonas sediminicola]MCP9290675.1 hypothetical protein [Gracilimonas sediminicola]